MKRDIKVLNNKLERHHGRLDKIEELEEPGVLLLGETSKLAIPLVNLVIQELLPDCNGHLKLGVVVVDYCPT